MMGNHFAPAFASGVTQKGMDHLELISALALPGVITAKPLISKEAAAKEAIEYADVLLQELAKRKAPPK